MSEGQYVAVVAAQKYLGCRVMKPGQQVKLVKEPENDYDAEAVKVELEPVGQIGYVANSVHTVPKGCRSAGRIYDTFDETAGGTVRFVMRDMAIVEIGARA